MNLRRLLRAEHSAVSKISYPPDFGQINPLMLLVKLYKLRETNAFVFAPALKARMSSFAGKEALKTAGQPFGRLLLTLRRRVRL